MAAPEDTTFLSQVLAWVAAGIAAVGAWLWTTTMGRIAKLEEGKVNQKTFDEYVARADKDRGERRETELSLFRKMDNMRDHVDERFDKLAELIRASKQ